MAQYYTVQKTAQRLGISDAEVEALREENTLRGFRTGGEWKFKEEDVEAYASENEGTPDDSFMLDEGSGLSFDFDESVPDDNTSDSGFFVPDEKREVSLDGEDGVDIDFEDDEDTASIDFAVDDEELVLEEDTEVGPPEDSGSVLELGSSDNALDGVTGVDLDIDNDSGISLATGESGLSLEDDDDSFEIEGDDLVLEEDDDDDLNSLDSFELSGDDDFELTPMDEGDSDDDSASGSQVITLAPDEDPMFEDFNEEGVSSEFEEGEFADDEFADASPAAPLLDPNQEIVDRAELKALMNELEIARLPAKPYSIGVVILEGISLAALIFCGVAIADLMVSLQTTGELYTGQSALFDWLLETIGGKK